MHPKSSKQSAQTCDFSLYSQCPQTLQRFDCGFHSFGAGRIHCFEKKFVDINMLRVSLQLQSNLNQVGNCNLRTIHWQKGVMTLLRKKCIIVTILNTSCPTSSLN